MFIRFSENLINIKKKLLGFEPPLNFLNFKFKEIFLSGNFNFIRFPKKSKEPYFFFILNIYEYRFKI